MCRVLLPVFGSVAFSPNTAVTASRKSSFTVLSLNGNSRLSSASFGRVRFRNPIPLFPTDARYSLRTLIHSLTVAVASDEMNVIRPSRFLVCPDGVLPRIFSVAGTVDRSTSSHRICKSSPIRIPPDAKQRITALPFKSVCWRRFRIVSVSISSSIVATPPFGSWFRTRVISFLEKTTSDILRNPWIVLNICAADVPGLFLVVIWMNLLKSP